MTVPTAIGGSLPDSEAVLRQLAVLLRFSRLPPADRQAELQIEIRATHGYATRAIYLPDMSGLAVLRELRQRQERVDVIMVTADRDVASLRAAMEGGALQYIVKPFDFARFRETLENYQRFLDRRSALGAVEQADVDRLYASIRPTREQALPKGLNRATLELVLEYLRHRPDAASAYDVANGTGVSRGTARRYLEFLEGQGRTSIELRYGAAGRPEHRYRLRL